MTVAAGPNIVKSGLVLCLDAANTRSYPGGTATWTDISGSGNNATLANAGYNSTTKAITLSAANGTMSVSALNLSSTNHTIMYLSKQTGIKLRVLTAVSNNWLLGYWNNASSQYYAEGWITSVGTPAAEEAWVMYTGTGDLSTDKWSLWKNSTKTVTDSASGTQGPNGLSINIGAFTEKSDCEVSIILAYNRVLTDAEILQNHNALKGRYGL
jgi:hypothetical protein